MWVFPSQVIRFVLGIRFFKKKNPVEYSFSDNVKHNWVTKELLFLIPQILGHRQGGDLQAAGTTKLSFNEARV